MNKKIDTNSENRKKQEKTRNIQMKINNKNVCK